MRNKHDELVAPQASQHIGMANSAQHPMGDRHQQLVTDQMTKKVVNLLEPVKIQKLQGKLL